MLVAVTGSDDNGCFTAASACNVEEFMEGDENFLETLIGSVLFYNKYMKKRSPESANHRNGIWFK